MTQFFFQNNYFSSGYFSCFKMSFLFPKNKEYLSKVTFNTDLDTSEISLLKALVQMDETAMNLQNSPNFLVRKVFLI